MHVKILRCDIWDGHAGNFEKETIPLVGIVQGENSTSSSSKNNKWLAFSNYMPRT